MTDYGASNARLLGHVGSALTLVAIVMNRTIEFQCSSNVNSDSIFFVTGFSRSCWSNLCKKIMQNSGHGVFA